MPARRVGVDEAIAAVADGACVMVGGFGPAGSPVALIDALAERSRATGLTILSNNCGQGSGQGLGRLLLQGRVRRVVGTFFTINPDVARLHREGRLEVQLLPQGTFAEAIRAGGAGLAAFYTRTGVGTALAEGKEVREFDGEPYLLERALRADVALLGGYRADELGNVVYSKTGRNFNPLMAMAADLVIAEVEEVVPAGGLDPESVVTPHVFVDLLVERGVNSGAA